MHLERFKASETYERNELVRGQRGRSAFRWEWRYRRGIVEWLGRKWSGEKREFFILFYQVLVIEEVSIGFCSRCWGNWWWGPTLDISLFTNKKFQKNSFLPCTFWIWSEVDCFCYSVYGSKDSVLFPFWLQFTDLSSLFSFILKDYQKVF